MTNPGFNTFLKRMREIFNFAAHNCDSSVARESKKASCAALRSNASKNAFVKSSKNASRKACGSCTSRALLSLFVASATLLATFVIAPTSALSAGENTGATEKTEGAQSGSAKSGSVKDDGELNKQSEQSEPNNNTEPNKKNTDTSSTLNKDNKESNPVEKQQNADVSVDKAKSETAVNKKAKDAKKKGVDSAKDNGNSTDRVANEESELPEVCRKNKRHNTFAKCYVVSYYNGDGVFDNNNPVLIQRGNTITIKPKFEIKLDSTNRQAATMPSDVWFELGKYAGHPVPSWVNFEKKEKNGVSLDGSVTLRPNGKWDYGSYRFKVFAYYKSKKEKISVTISVKVDVSGVQNDLTLSLYDFVNKKDKTPVSGNKITIKPKSKGSAPSGGSDGSTTDSTDNKDVYDPINKLFIDSKSIKKPSFIYHRMICKTGSDDNASYTVDSVNGLSLGTQTQFKHVEKPTSGSDKYSVYLDDDYTERSQSWISGTPTKSGTFECRVFAIKKDDEFKLERKSEGGKVNVDSTVLDEFDTRVETNKQSLFEKPEQNIVEDKWTNKASIKQGIDWDYKSVTIEVQSSKPPEPEIGDNDLTLKVYPFKNSDGSLPAELPDKNNKISAILGMSLKPFVDATSAADSKNKITLRVLCSKGEKKNAGSRFVQPSEQSQPTQPSGSPQSAEDLEYKTWSSNLAELGLSVPADDNQNTCHSNKEGNKTCESADPSKKVAARTDMEVSIKPTEVGNYQCVVYALKPKAFNAQSGKQTPTDIDEALAGDKSLKEHKDFAAFTFNLHSVSKFTLPHTGGQSWNLQLGILAALLVNLLAAGFVVSQSERGRKLILGRWRGLCNYV